MLDYRVSLKSRRVEVRVWNKANFLVLFLFGTIRIVFTLKIMYIKK